MAVREAHPDDLPAILRLMAQPGMDGSRVLDESGARGTFASIEANPAHCVYVAEADGGVIGTFALVVVQHLSHRGGRSAVVEDVVVEAAWRGRGVGRAMMRFAADEAHRRGCYKLALSSSLQRTGAHAFYEGLGLERHGYSFVLPLRVPDE